MFQGQIGPLPLYLKKSQFGLEMFVVFLNIIKKKEKKKKREHPTVLHVFWETEITVNFLDFSTGQEICEFVLHIREE